MRRWSSSFIITLMISSPEIATPRGPSASASSRLIRCRSTSNCRSSLGELFEVEVLHVGDRAAALGGGAELFEELAALLEAGAAHEAMAGGVAGQADARGDHDVALVAEAGHPLADALIEFRSMHPCSRPAGGCGPAAWRPPRIPRAGPRVRASRRRRISSFSRCNSIPGARGHRADVPRAVLDLLQERADRLLEDVIVVRAAEPAGGAELRQADAARRADRLRRRAVVLQRAVQQPLEQLREVHHLLHRRRPSAGSTPRRGGSPSSRSPRSP